MPIGTGLSIETPPGCSVTGGAVALHPARAACNWSELTQPRCQNERPRTLASARPFPSKPDESLGAPVAQQLARSRPGAFAFGEGLDPVDDDRAVTPGMLHPPPFPARKIV